ncbi:hypothetical protein FQN50_007887 [Emmonsiellopsis sp. PD_5]|nr:hypothetical protein FQN50_007887 [Emmonsiellopsis sp. PD_5]
MAHRGPKARDFDYSNVGKAGRRTGITLKEGKLDEHGMEEIDGMFSSPEKSPVRTNGNGFANDTLNSEDMETGDSSIPEPADVLSGRRGQRNPFVLPPRSRSPMKTLLSGSPRRTPGFRSSSVPHHEQSSSPTSSRPAAKRALNFSQPQQSVGRSPLGALGADIADEGKGRTVAEVEEDDTPDFSDDGNHLLDEAEDTHFMESHGDYHESYENANLESAEDQEEEEDRDDADDQPQSTDEDPEDEISPPPIPAKTATRGTKRKNPPANEPKPTAQKGKAAGSTDNPGPKRRGRKPKAQTTEAPADSNDEAEAENPRAPKRTKTGVSKGRATNLQMSAEQEKELNSVVENITSRNGPLKSRSLYILKRETPSDESARHTRSGRVSVRPLAYWRNERCVYGDGSAEVGQRFPLSTIKEIIRTEEVDTRPDKKSKRGGKKKSKSKRAKDDSSDDEGMDDAEPWEYEDGIFVGPVKKWDPETQAATEEEEMTDIALAPSAITTHEVKGSTFRFAKVFHSEFLGSGFVDMPPGAVKRQKNSKKMHMIFFVYRGRIHVDIAGLQFSAGKGSVFQVPRGNNYSLSNDYDKDAAIFFTQGFLPQETEDTAQPTPPPPSDQVPAAEEPPAEAPKKRGRKKQN